jgi:site-specific recombinase XerD
MNDRSRNLTPREASERWLSKVQASKSESTRTTYYYQIKQFIEWAESRDIRYIGDITGWDIDTYAMYRRDQGLETITLNKELGTVKNFLEYCSRIELVDGDVPEKVDIPKVPHQKNVSEKLLSVKRANMLFRFYDQSEKQYSTEYALLVIEWFNGSRLGGIRGLDIGSYTPSNKSEYEEGYLEYRHRPEIGLPLKNDYDGERIVGLPEYADNIVGSYVDENRKESYDENGFRPLITTSTGRASVGTIRAWTYLATEPCLHTDCPHGNTRNKCKFTDYSYGSKCPSSRSPHQVRTGSITWQLNKGVPLDRVSERVNTSQRILKKHYDHPSQLESFEERRRQYLSLLSFEEGEAEGDIL